MATTMEQRAKFRELRLAGTSREDAMKQAYGSVAPVPPTANPPYIQTKEEAIGKIVNQVGGDVKSRQEARKLAEAGLSAEEINNVRSRPNWGTPEDTTIKKQAYQQGMPMGMKSVDYTQTGVNGETFQVAPVNPQTGLSQPTPTPQPAPVNLEAGLSAPQNTTQPKMMSNGMTVNDYNAFKAANPNLEPTQEDIAKLNYPSTTPTPTPEQLKRDEISAQNEAQMALNKQQAELRQQERDKATQEANNQLANDENAIYRTLSSGGVIPEAVKTSPYYKRAENTYKQVQNFRTMSQAQLSNAISNGSILPGTEVYNKLIQDPTMAQRVKEARIYATPPNQDQILQDQSSKILSENSKVAQFLEDGILSMDEYNKMTNNSDVVAQAKLREEKLSALNAFNKEWNDARDRIKREFAGSAFLDSMLADLDSGYKTRADYLQNEVDIATGTLTDLKATATSLFNANINEYIAYRNAQIGVDTTRINTLNQNQATLAQNQALFDQQIAQQAQQMGTPELAIPSVINQYAEMGIMASKSAQQHIADAKAFIARGGTLGEYISQMQKDFQAKPEYKAKFSPQATYQTFGNEVYKLVNGELTPTGIKTGTVTQDWSKLDDTTLYNQRTGELKKVSASEASAYGPSPQEVTPDAIKGLSSRLSGNNVQCGMVSNDWMAVKFPQAKRMGDSYESKVASVESIGVSDVPQVGGVFAMNTYNSNGHTGIVQSVDLANGTFTATDANRKGSTDGGPVVTSTYKISDNFTFSKGPAGAGQIRPSDIDYFNSATPTDKKKLSSNPQYIDFSNKKSTVMGDPNADIYEVMQYSQGGKDMDAERLKLLGKFSQGLSQIAELSKKIQETETGPIIGRIRSYNPYDANAQALLAEINSTVPNIARGVYGEVGVLTDADIQNYAKTLPNIKSTEDTNKLVLAMTLKTMLNGFKGQIQIDGSAGRDVSGFVGTVKQYEDRINQLLSQLGGGNASTPSVNNTLQSDWDNLDNLP